MNDALDSSASDTTPTGLCAVTSEVRRPLVLLAICTLGGLSLDTQNRIA